MLLFTNLFLISFIHGALLITVLLIQNQKRFNEIAFLIVFLAIITGYVLREYLYLLGYFEALPHLMAFFVPLLYLMGPVYYFYVRSSVIKAVSFERTDLWHLVPALICFFTILPFYLKSGEEKLTLYSSPEPGNLELAANRILYYGFMLLSWFFYAWKSLKLINDTLNSFDGRTIKAMSFKLKWLKNYTWVFIAFLLCFLIAQLIFVFTDFYPYYVMLSTVLASSILIHFVGYSALRTSRIINSEKAGNIELQFSESRLAQLKNQIIYLLSKDKIYKKSDLSINDFCEHLSINSKYISQLVNTEFKCSLTFLINSYRVEAAKEMIISSKYNHLNFLGIATEVGFNTKNTFTRAFKRHTGITPSQYKLQVDIEMSINS